MKENSQQKDLEIAQLKEWNIQKDETINVIKQVFEDLKNELDHVREQLSKQIENNEKELSEKSNQNKENIEKLEKFADTISRLHHTLSNPSLRTNQDYHWTLLQENYDQDNDVMEWNHFVEESNAIKDCKCDYMGKLRDSINKYSATVYNRKYEKRLKIFCHTTPLGTSYPFIRIGCENCYKSICVKTFEKLEHFENEIRRNNRKKFCKIQNNHFTYSYFDFVGDTLHVVLWAKSDKVYLLHNSKEEEKMELPIGEVVKVENMASFTVDDSIVLHIK